MARRKTTTARPGGRAPQVRTPSRFETSPERIACIYEVIDAMRDAGGITTHDAFSDEDSLRTLASNLRVPYLALQVSRLGSGGITETDVDEYNAWRAALDKGGAR